MSFLSRTFIDACPKVNQELYKCMHFIQYGLLLSQRPEARFPLDFFLSFFTCWEKSHVYWWIHSFCSCLQLKFLRLRLLFWTLFAQLMEKIESILTWEKSPPVNNNIHHQDAASVSCKTPQINVIWFEFSIHFLFFSISTPE